MSQVLLERLLYALVILRDPIRVDMCEIFLVCLVAVAFSTLACMFVDPLFDLSFCKEAGVAVQLSHLRDQSLPLVKVVFHIQMAEDEVSFEHVQIEKDQAIWRFYRSIGDEREMPTRPSHAILTAYHQAKLFRICRDCLNLYCGYSGKITAQKVITLHRHYTKWKEDLPPILKKVDVESQPLPHILYP